MQITVSKLRLGLNVKTSRVVKNSHNSHKSVCVHNALCLPANPKRSAIEKRKLANSKSASKIDCKKSGQLEAQMLRDLFKIFKFQKSPYIRTRDLIARLCADPSKPWASFYQGSNLTARHLSALLRPYGVSSCCIYYKKGNAKGYKKEAVIEAYHSSRL